MWRAHTTRRHSARPLLIVCTAFFIVCTAFLMCHDVMGSHHAPRRSATSQVPSAAQQLRPLAGGSASAPRGAPPPAQPLLELTVPSPDNRAALYSSATDDWSTPPDFYARLDADFGFALDVCSSVANHRAPTFYALDHPDPSRRDGLARDWAADAAVAGGAVWMNPPYGRTIAAWMAKAHETARAGSTVVCLVPVRGDAAWWHNQVLATGAEVRFVRGRLTFGDAKNTAAFASAVVIYRSTDVPGKPGQVGVIAAKVPSQESAPTEALGGGAQSEAAAAVAAYTPRSMTADRWALAAETVRATVTAIKPRDAHSARVYASTLTWYLNQPGCWDGRRIPDLTELLRLDTITRVTNVTASHHGHTSRRAQLRQLSRAIGIAPDTVSVAPGMRRPPADPLLLAAAQRTVSVADLVAGMRARAGGNYETPGLTEVVSALVQVNAIVTSERAVTVWSPASIRGLAEVSDQTAKVTVTSHKNLAALPATAGKPMSRRAVLAHARQMADRAKPEQVAPTPQVAAHIAKALADYTPSPRNRAAWSANLGLAHRLVLGYQPPSARNAGLVCSHVAGFLSWYSTWPGRGASGPVTAEELTEDVVEAWVRAATQSDRSRATIRSTMRRAIRSLYPGRAPLKVAHKPIAAPYSADEMLMWRRLAAAQPTPARTARVSFLVGLGAGAGLDASDLRNITAEALTEVWLGTAEPVLMVTISNPRRPRTVPVRADYAALVRRALALHSQLGKAPSDLIVGQVRDRINVVNAFHRTVRTATDDLMVQLARLRNTWLVATMCAPVSLADLLRAAGLVSSRTMTDLLCYCPPGDKQAVDNVLSGASR